MEDYLFPDEKTGVYVSANYLSFMLRGLQIGDDSGKRFKLNFDLMRNKIRENTRLVTCNYYFNHLNDQYDPARKLADKLSFNGWRVVGHERIVKQSGDKVSCYNIDPLVDMSLDIFQDSYNLDHVILFTSDSNIVPAINRVARNTCRVTVVSSLRTPFGRIDDLRRAATEFIDISTLSEFISTEEKI